MNRTPGNISTVLNRDYIQLHVSRSFDEDLEALKSQVQRQIGSRTQFRRQALELLTKLYLPQPSPANIGEWSLYSWLPSICGHQGDSQALDHTLLAFCVVQVAVTNTGSASVDEALEVYSDALQKLRGEIEDFGARRSDEILATISVLSTSEVLLSWQSSSYTEL